MDDVEWDQWLEPDVFALPGSGFDAKSADERPQILSINAVLEEKDQASETTLYPVPARVSYNAYAPYYGLTKALTRVGDLDQNAPRDTGAEQIAPASHTIDDGVPKQETLQEPQTRDDAPLALVAGHDLQVEAGGPDQDASGDTSRLNKRAIAQRPLESNKRSKVASALAVIPQAPPPKPRSGTREWVADGEEAYHAAVGTTKVNMPKGSGSPRREEVDEDGSATLVDRASLTFEPHPCRYRPCPLEGKHELLITPAQRDEHEDIHKQSNDDQNATLTFERFPCRYQPCGSEGNHEPFMTPGKRNKHEKIHNEFHCKPCRRHYSSQEQLDQHKAENHANGGKKSFFCHICGSKLARKDYILRHVQDVHQKKGKKTKKAKEAPTESIASSQTAVEPALQHSTTTSPKLDHLSSPLGLKTVPAEADQLYPGNNILELE